MSSRAKKKPPLTRPSIAAFLIILALMASVDAAYHQRDRAVYIGEFVFLLTCLVIYGIMDGKDRNER